MIGLLLAAPCAASVPLDAGQRAGCDGVLISADRAKRAVADAREVKIRRQHACPACPACPEPQSVEGEIATASASFVAGLLLGLLLVFVR